MEKYAVITGNSVVYEDIVMTAKSLLDNSAVDKIFLLVEHDPFPEPLPECVEAINVSNQTFFAKDGPNMNSPYTYFAMMRAALALMPQFRKIDKILSLDCDTVVLKNVDGLWSLPIDDCYFAASHETHRTNNGLLYCNTGVAMYNLAKLRDGKADEVVEVLNRRKYTWLEQDLFNYLCQGRIFDMPAEYNVNDWTEKCYTVYIRHFAGVAASDWRWRPEAQEYRNKRWGEVLHGRK